MTESAVVLDASMTIERALAKLSLYSRDTWFVIRDDRATQDGWYVMDGWDLHTEIGDLDGQLTLREAAVLDSFGAQAQQSMDPDGVQQTAIHTVILDGTEVVGVVPARDHVIPGLYRDWLPNFSHDDPAAARRAHFFAWPSIAAPTTAMQGEEVVITVALSKDQQPSAALWVHLLPNESEFDLEVDVAAIGFDAPGGWRHKLHINVANDRHAIAIPLRVRSDAPEGRTVVHVAFLKDGIVCGNATCVIAIGAPEEAIGFGQSSPCVLPAQDDEPGDLLVMIRKADDNPATGRYVWSMSSTRAGVDSGPFPIDLGDDARTFARSLMRDVVEADGTALLEPVLKSIGIEIAKRVPSAFWDALHVTAAAIRTEQRPLSVLLQSAEEFVPWELAFMARPLDDAPPYLAAQVSLGRWLHSQTGAVPVRPPSLIQARDIAVLAPDYEGSGRTRLERALAEARYMIDAHGAIAINATEDDIRLLLDAEVARGDGSRAEIGIVHYAGHGSGDPTRPGSAGLFLVNGKRLSPRVFGATRLGNHFGPFLFINACEAGMAQRLLDDNAGFAAISLRGGFRGFIAPLWAVDDHAAWQVACRFYDMTLAANPEDVGTVLRDLRRSAFANRDATSLSYVYYGHPRLALRQKASQ